MQVTVLQDVVKSTKQRCQVGGDGFAKPEIWQRWVYAPFLPILALWNGGGGGGCETLPAPRARAKMLLRRLLRLVASVR